MSNIQLKLSENKKIKYLEQKVVGRIGEKNLTTIDVYLQKADFKTPYVIPTDATVKFIAETNTNNYTDGYASIVDGEKGFIQYTFTEDNFSDSSGKGKRPFKAAYFELETSDGNRVTFQDFEVYVLPRADISADQATYYVSSLEKILSTFQVTFDQFIIDNTVTYDEFYEKYNNLIRRINESDSKADDVVSKVNAALIEFETGDFFNKQESSANVIYQILGKDITEITFTLNFKNKKTNSLVENPNKARVSANNNLITPTTVLNDYSQERYNSVSEIDKNYMAIWLETANQRAQSLFEFAILEEVIRHLGVDFFELQGLTTLKDQTTFLRSKMTNIQSDIWGKGVSQKGNKFYYTTFDNRGNNWGSLVTNESNTVEKTSLIISQSDLEIYLSDSGNMYFLAYSEQTDGTLATQLYIDYVELSFKLRVSTRDVIESMIAANHRENLATQEEAEEGLNESKTMTPVRVFQAIAKWIANKFVSVAGNETILGIKNFTGGLLVSDKRVLTVDDILQTSGTIPLINGNTGVLKYTKQLKNVTLTFNGLNGKYGGTPSGSTLANLPADLRPANYFEELVGSTDRGAVNTAALSFATTGEINWQRNSSTASDYSFEVTYQTI